MPEASEISEIPIERWRSAEELLNREEFYESLEHTLNDGPAEQHALTQSDEVAQSVLLALQGYHASRRDVLHDKIKKNGADRGLIALARESVVLSGEVGEEIRVAPDLKAMKEALKLFRDRNQNDAHDDHEIIGDVIKDLEKNRRCLLEVALRDDTVRSPRIVAALSLIGEHIEGWKEIRSSIAERDPDAFYTICHDRLIRYINDLKGGRLVRTPYVDETIDSVLGALSRQEVPFVYGDTGSGKTELSRVAAQEFSGQPPLVIRCYDGMDSSELFGYLGLSSKGAAELSTIPDEIENAIASWESSHQSASEDEKNAAIKQITEASLRRQSVTVSQYVLGAIYRAAAEGRVVLIDEVNFMPPQLFAKLNDIFTKRVGESIEVQEDGARPIKILPGYGVLLTGNLNQSGSKKYKNRKDLDPAQLDRLTLIHHDYLPQATTGSLSQVEKPKDKELYTIVLANLLDGGGNLYAPERSIERIWALAQYAKVTQLAFANRIGKDSSYSFKSGGVAVQVETDVLVSPRVLHRIIEEWRADGFGYELDHYVYKHLIARAQKAEDKAYLYQIGQMFAFFRSTGWTQDMAYEGQQHVDLTCPKNKTLPCEFVYSRDVVRAVFGAGPVRTIWPDRDISPELERNAAMGALVKEQANLARVQNDTSKLAVELLRELGEPPAELLVQHPSLRVIVERLRPRVGVN